jgi:hypothetical protein
MDNEKDCNCPSCKITSALTELREAGVSPEVALELLVGHLQGVFTGIDFHFLGEVAEENLSEALTAAVNNPITKVVH